MKSTGPIPTVPLKSRLLAALLCGAVRALYVTLRVWVEREPAFESLLRDHKSVILVTWHGRSLVPIARSVGKGYVGMVSLSRDGTLLSECFRQLGWRTIRGSSGRTGVRAMKAALDVLETDGTVLTITPDGPRGPERKVQPGVVFLAQKSGKPILPVGIGVCRFWQAGSWDRFQVPLPFSRVTWLYGRPLFVAPDADIERACLELERRINAIEAEAGSAFQKPSRSGDRADCSMAYESGQRRRESMNTDGTTALPARLESWIRGQGLENCDWREAGNAEFLPEEDSWLAGTVCLTRVPLSPQEPPLYVGRAPGAEEIYYWLDGFQLPDTGDWCLSR